MEQQKDIHYQPPPQGPPPPYNSPPAVGFQAPGQVIYPAPPMASTSSSTTVVTGQPIPGQQPMIIMATGNCPACRNGILQMEFTACGICLAICCFPIGILCCWVMRERKCSSCRASCGK